MEEHQAGLEKLPEQVHWPWFLSYIAHGLCCPYRKTQSHAGLAWSRRHLPPMPYAARIGTGPPLP